MKDYIILGIVIVLCIIIIAFRVRNAYIEEERKRNGKRKKLQ